MRVLRIVTVLMCCNLLVMVCSPAYAQTLSSPTGKVILRITGMLEIKNSPEGAIFDLEMLKKMPQHQFRTQTPWDREPVLFQGPLLRDVLTAVRAKGTLIQAVALNDFRTSIPVEDAKRFEMIVAYKMNGELIPVRTKGPLFIVYPYDSNPVLQSQVYYGRSPWQLMALTIQ